MKKPDPRVSFTIATDTEHQFTYQFTYDQWQWPSLRFGMTLAAIIGAALPAMMIGLLLSSARYGDPWRSIPPPLFILILAISPILLLCVAKAYRSGSVMSTMVKIDKDRQMMRLETWYLNRKTGEHEARFHTSLEWSFSQIAKVRVKRYPNLKHQIHSILASFKPGYNRGYPIELFRTSSVESLEYMRSKIAGFLGMPVV
jgi:hypothetical protein